MSSKKRIIKFNQLKKDSTRQEVLEYFNKGSQGTPLLRP